MSCSPVDSTHQDGETGYDGPPVYDVCILDFGKTKVKVSYSSGPSADPVFGCIPFPKDKNQMVVNLRGARYDLVCSKGNNVYAEVGATRCSTKDEYTYNGTKLHKQNSPIYTVE